MSQDNTWDEHGTVLSKMTEEVIDELFKELFNCKTGPLIDAGTTQKELEILYSKHQKIKLIKREAINSGIPTKLRENGIDVDFGLDALAQMQLHKQANLTTLGGVLVKHFEHMHDPAQACADALFDMVQYDFINYNTATDKFVVKYQVSKDVEERLDMFQYPLPMIEKPEPVTNNRQTGYQTIRGSLILKNNHTDDDVCRDHINRVNAIPLKVNVNTVAFIRNQWADLDRRRDGEEQEDYLKRRTAFKVYDETSRDVIRAISAHERFWLTHKFDKRGRTYAQGYHVNYQGNDWNKSCVEFADAEVLNKE